MRARSGGVGRLAASVAVLVAAVAVLLAAAAASGEGADVVGVEVHCHAEHTCRFDVTVRHPDTGWDHYADRWDVVTPDGKVIATRVLQHPHVGEQPFTRSLPWVEIPEGVREVRVRARDSRDGWGGAERTVAIPPYAPGAGARKRPESPAKP